jgi:hypothetical protein
MFINRTRYFSSKKKSINGPLHKKALKETSAVLGDDGDSVLLRLGRRLYAL